MTSSFPQRLFTAQTAAASVIVVLASISSVLPHLPANRGLLLVCAGSYVAIATLGSYAVDRAGHGRWALLAGMILSGGAAVWISRGGTILILMPLISLVAVRYSRPANGALVLSLAVWIAVAVGFSGRGFQSIATTLGNFLAAATFTIIFSRLVVSERRASGELATARERNRIAREIHDTLGHYLTSANIQLEAARAMIGDQSPATERLRHAQRLLREGLGEVRKSVAMLRASGGDRPFTTALRALVDEVRAGGLAVELRITGAVRPLAPAVEFALYRAAQEALTNTRRHARARSALLVIDYGHDGVDLTVEDDGVGGAADAPEGFGLLGLRERVEMLGGAVELGNVPDGGMALRVRVPA